MWAQKPTPVPKSHGTGVNWTDAWRRLKLMWAGLRTTLALGLALAIAVAPLASSRPPVRAVSVCIIVGVCCWGRARRRIVRAAVKARNRWTLLQFAGEADDLGLCPKRAQVPKVRRIRASAVSVTFDVRLGGGPTLHDWQKKAPDLADALGVVRITVGRTDPGWATLAIFRKEPLDRVVPHPRLRG